MIKWLESSGAKPPNPHLEQKRKDVKMKKIFKGIRKKEQGNKFVTENIMHVITRTNRAECGAVCQNDRLSAGHIWQTRSHVYDEVKCQAEVRSDLVIPNKLGNGETCQGLCHWRLLHNLNNNFSIPVRNDMDNKTVTNLFPYFTISIFLKKKFAFTLAEVLITLGIIGVVAAITIPGLINNYKANKLRTQFLKSYSVIQQVFKQMEASDVSLDPSTYSGSRSSFYKEFRKFLNGSTDCGISSRRTYPCAAIDNTFNYKTYDQSGIANRSYFDDGQIALPDGTLIMFENPVWAGNIWLSVDINGYDNPPNIWGYDLFTFEFQDGELRTMGDKNTRYSDMNQFCNLRSQSVYNGIACAQKAKTDTDYFKWVVKNIK